MRGFDTDTQFKATGILKLNLVALCLATIAFFYFSGHAGILREAFLSTNKAGKTVASSPATADAINQANAMSLLFGILAALLLLLLIGLMVYSFAVKGGSFEADKTDRRQVRILSRFSADEFGNLCFDNWEDISPGAKLYVQVQFENGRERELMVAWEIFLQCGEGMEGIGVIEGNYLIGFVPPQVIMQHQPIPPDPFHKGP